MNAMSKEEQSKVWLITGSSRGLGRALVEAALAGGHKLVATARNPTQLADLVERSIEDTNLAHFRAQIGQNQKKTSEHNEKRRFICDTDFWATADFEFPRQRSAP